MHAALPEIWMKWYKFLLLLPESWRNLIQCDDMILPEVMAQDASNFALISWFLDEYGWFSRILCFTRTLCFTWTRATIQRRLQSWFLLSDVSKSWSRTRANLPWFHCFSTNTDASPGYYASPGHYASPGLEQQFNVGSSHNFFCLMFRILFCLPSSESPATTTTLSVCLTQFVEHLFSFVSHSPGFIF